MQTKTVNGQQYYLHRAAGGKNIWKPVSSLNQSDMTIVNVAENQNTDIEVLINNVKRLPPTIATSVTGQSAIMHNYSVNGNTLEVTLTIQWNNRRPTETIRVFVNNGSVDAQSFQIEIDDQGYASVLTGSAKVTQGRG